MQAGIHGQATTGRAGTDGTLPLADIVASIVVANLDATKAIKREELFPVLRPLGKAYLKSDGKWSVTTKPRPKDLDDRLQYPHDAAMATSEPRRVQKANSYQYQSLSETDFPDARIRRTVSTGGMGESKLRDFALECGGVILRS